VPGLSAFEPGRVLLSSIEFFIELLPLVMAIAVLMAIAMSIAIAVLIAI
jgi:hypothetical protein